MNEKRRPQGRDNGPRRDNAPRRADRFAERNGIRGVAESSRKGEQRRLRCSICHAKTIRPLTSRHP